MFLFLHISVWLMWCFFVALFFYLYKLYNKFLIFQEATRRNDAKEGGGRTRSVSTSFSIQTSEPYPRSSDWHYDIYYEVPPSNIMLLPGSLTSDVELSQRLQYPSGLNPMTSRPHMEVFLWKEQSNCPTFLFVHAAVHMPRRPAERHVSMTPSLNFFF